MILLELFWNFFQIGLFTVGGGYASLPLIQSRIVDVNGWMTLNEFTDLIAISQMTPGPVSYTHLDVYKRQTGCFRPSA